MNSRATQQHEVILKTESNIEPNYFAVAAVFMLVLTVGLFILQSFKFQVDATILETHVRALHLQSTRAQTALYLTLLGLFATICTITLLFPSIRIVPYAVHSDQIIMAIVMVTAIVFGSWTREFLLGFLFTAVALILLWGKWPIMDPDSWSKLSSGERRQLAGRVIFWILMAGVGCYILPLATPSLIHSTFELLGIKIYSTATLMDQVKMAIVRVITIALGSTQFLLGLLFAAIAIAILRVKWPIMNPDSWTNFLSGRWMQMAGSALFWLAVAGAGCYFILFVLLPLATPLLVHNGPEMRGIEGHYSVTVLPGFDLCCSRDGEVQRANYGVAMPLLTALSLKVSSFFGVPDTDLVRAVKLNQLIAAVMICVLSYLLNKKNYPYIMVLALGLTAFTLSNVGMAVGYPNQSGIRFIPALAALIMLVLELRRARLRIWLLASVAALAVIMNPETGMATTVGFVVAVILKGYIPQAPIASTARALAQFAATFVIVLIIGSNLILEMILKDASGGLFQFVMLFTTGGYGGVVSKPSAVASLIFLVAITFVLRSVWHAREGVLQSTDVYEAAVGSIMLFWLMYYVNRMAEWNLWFELVLLVLIIAPRLTLSNGYLLFRQPAQFGGFSMAVACLIVGQAASSVNNFMPLAEEGIRWQRVGCDEGDNLDGKCLPWLKGTNFDLQMKALTAKFSRTDTLVLSGISTYARLRGFNEGFPWYDPMEIVHKDEVSTIVGWINSRGPKYVIADDPTYRIARAAPEHSNQIQIYIPLLSSYREVSRESGWIVLERVPGLPATAGNMIPMHP